MNNIAAGQRKYILGTEEELISLFGVPPIVFPDNIFPRPGHSLTVILNPDLKTQSTIFFQEAYKETRGGKLKQSKPYQDAYSHYQRSLEETLVGVVRSERRLGLINLFFLSHFLQLKQILRELFPGKNVGRYEVFTILKALMRTVCDRITKGFDKLPPTLVADGLGTRFNFGLIQALTTDHLFLTESSIEKLDFDFFLKHSPVYRIDSKTYQVLEETMAAIFFRGIRAGEKPYLEAMKAAGFNLEAGEKAISRWYVPFNDHFRRLILSEAEQLAEALSKERVLSKAAERLGGSGELIREFESLILGIKRTEYLENWSSNINIIPPGTDQKNQDEMVLRGELYRFFGGADPYPSPRRATILAGQLSRSSAAGGEIHTGKKVSQEIYTVFDPMATIVDRLEGRVDLYSGERFVATFGVLRKNSSPVLAAIRTAVLIQKYLQSLRGKNQTSFSIGLGLHTGLVSMAHLYLNRESKEVTTVGRPVDLASFLAVGQKKGEFESGPYPFEPGYEDGKGQTAQPTALGGITITSEGGMINNGIAVTREIVEAVYRERGESPPQVDKPLSFWDDRLKTNLTFAVVGEVRSDEWRATIPVYAVIYDY